ncbi:MAG: hypothetical protein NC115_06335 [Bacteroidales bacterium]|nr:hypothetical protein [Bacteroidales bacterium]
MATIKICCKVTIENNSTYDITGIYAAVYAEGSTTSAGGVGMINLPAAMAKGAATAAAGKSAMLRTSVSRRIVPAKEKTSLKIKEAALSETVCAE